MPLPGRVYSKLQYNKNILRWSDLEFDLLIPTEKLSFNIKAKGGKIEVRV